MHLLLLSKISCLLLGVSDTNNGDTYILIGRFGGILEKNKKRIEEDRRDEEGDRDREDDNGNVPHFYHILDTRAAFLIGHGRGMNDGGGPQTAMI